LQSRPLVCRQPPAREILTWLQSRGFDLLEDENNNDPDRPCYTLKRNDFLLRYQNLQQQLIKLAREKNEMVLLAANHKKLADERLETINRQSTEYRQQEESLGSNIQRLTNAFEHKSHLANEQEAKLLQLQKERDELAKLAEERQNALSRAESDRKKLVEDHTAKTNELSKSLADKYRLANEQEAKLLQLQKERDELAKLAEERLQSAEKMAAEHKDHLWRQDQLDEELIKAEAQIKLISDILIREKAF
jgi:chromosome segregation ATPase